MWEVQYRYTYNYASSSYDVQIVGVTTSGTACTNVGFSFWGLCGGSYLGADCIGGLPFSWMAFYIFANVVSNTQGMLSCLFCLHPDVLMKAEQAQMKAGPIIMLYKMQACSVCVDGAKTTCGPVCKGGGF